MPEDEKAFPSSMAVWIWKNGQDLNMVVSKPCFPVGFPLDPSVDVMQRIQDTSIPSLSDSWTGSGTAWLF